MPIRAAISIEKQQGIFLNGPFPASFSLFSSLQYTVDSIQMLDINKKIADDWIRTADLWYRKWPLYQLSHNYFPQLFVPNILIDLGT